MNCRIILHINHQPERFQVRKPLDGLLAMKEGTRAEIMAAAWKLVKVAGAQDKEDGSLIRPLGGLEKVSSRVQCLARVDTSRFCRKALIPYTSINSQRSSRDSAPTPILLSFLTPSESTKTSIYIPSALISRWTSRIR